MLNKIALSTLTLVSVQLYAESKWEIHPIVTVGGGYVIYVNAEQTRIWDPQNPTISVVQDAAIHIVLQQCPNGGFGWPHDDCSATNNNITPPIMEGIHQAWKVTNNNAYLGVMVDAGNYDLQATFANTEAKFGVYTPEFMWNLSRNTGDSTYTDFIETSLFTELQNSTYGPDDLDAAGWVASVVANRQGNWINLLPWEFRSLPLIAQRHCRPAQADVFEQALLDGFNTMNDTSPNTVYNDITGLSGGIWGLASLNRQTFPAINAPLHAINGMTSLQQLVDFLVSHQNPDGSWYWHTNLNSPSEAAKDTQSTAYAVMALIKANERLATDYLPAINLGQNWLESMQGQFGGFISGPGGVENTEIEAEALTALATIGVYDKIFSNNLECYPE